MFDATGLPLVFGRSQALRWGMSRHAMTWRAAHGEWHTLRRGAFCRSAVYDRATPEGQHLLVALAALTVGDRREVISHISAALAYGWPGPLDLEELPWFTLPRELTGPTRRRSGVIRQVAPLPPGQIWTRHGIRLTSPARTVADCLRHFPAEVSLPIADAAIHNGVDGAEVARILQSQSGWPYTSRGVATARLVDGRRESWLESRSAVSFRQIGLPQPECQTTIFDDRGRAIARVDFLWAEAGVIGEADGYDKYVGGRLDSTSGPKDALAVLRREKDREDQLRGLGYEIARWGTADALFPHRALAERLERALGRADSSRIRGSRRAGVMPRPGPLSAVRLDELSAEAVDGLLVAPNSPYSRSAGASA